MNTSELHIEYCYVGSDDVEKCFVRFAEPQPFSYILSIMKLGRERQTLHYHLKQIFDRASIVVEISNVDHYGKDKDQKFLFYSPDCR
ncbi:MAG: hypothetical protein V4469_01560 [Patescibacteria group bacterium]